MLLRSVDDNSYAPGCGSCSGRAFTPSTVIVAGSRVPTIPAPYTHQAKAFERLQRATAWLDPGTLRFHGVTEAPPLEGLVWESR